MARKYGYTVASGLTGHGIGRDFHGMPIVLHVDNPLKTIMKPGMMFTIEPLFLESDAGLSMWEDRWTIVSADNCRAAQYENTVLISETGVEILTKRSSE